MVSPLRDCSILRSWPPANSEIVAHSGTTITQQFGVALTVVSFGRIPPRHVSVGAGSPTAARIREFDARQRGIRHRMDNCGLRLDGLQPVLSRSERKTRSISLNHSMRLAA